MAIRLDFGDAEAIVDGGEWACDEPHLLALLRARAELLDPTTPDVPDVDGALAADAVNALGAIVLEDDGPDAAESPGEGVVY